MAVTLRHKISCGSQSLCCARVAQAEAEARAVPEAMAPDVVRELNLLRQGRLTEVSLSGLAASHATEVGQALHGPLQRVRLEECRLSAKEVSLWAEQLRGLKQLQAGRHLLLK